MFRACTSSVSTFTALATLAITAASCASPENVSSGAEADIRSAEGAICTFPTRSYAIPIADHYIRWSGDAEREAYLPGFLTMMGLTRSDDRGPLPMLQGIVDELYPAIRAVLPAETQSLDTPPHVVLLHDEHPNAFAASDPRGPSIRAPWLLFVNDSLVTMNAPASEVKGVMAHELAHLMAKHQFPDTPTRVRRYYRVGDRDEKKIASSLESDDPKVRAYAEKVEDLMAYAGAFEAPELNGFPVKFSGLTKPIRYHVLFETLKTLGTSECAAHATKYAEFQESLRAHLSRFDHTFKLETDAAKADVSIAAKATEQAAHACVTSAGGPVSLTDLAVSFELMVRPERSDELENAQATGGAEAVRRLVLDADEIAVDDAGATDDVVTKLLALGKKKHQRLAALAAGSGLGEVSGLRRYAEEAEADQIAVRVLRHAGLDATGGAGFLLRTMDPAAQETCNAVLGRGEVPPFGGFAFLHPATCWRVFQARTFAKTLETSCRGE